MNSSQQILYIYESIFSLRLHKVEIITFDGEKGNAPFLCLVKRIKRGDWGINGQQCGEKCGLRGIGGNGGKGDKGCQGEGLRMGQWKVKGRRGVHGQVKRRTQEGHGEVKGRSM